ncbi:MULTISPECIES: NAD(P)-dependent oxidoreductase [unclassified Plantactinospora]|uniref:NAD-dependent epimerase/dehydratase family protein n=1 Tax=unclassified Plantactinospora TaxID=2631981 RepID=UPI000D17DC9D|nr:MULTISPECIES: NAD(P)-dependent oxidoreductase [unclassified Plantactinospora]AVT33236.1 NAD-dependent dehydratase [Plantactinospora sp. BC1]AVT40801.1 NAD-dependent dehydratase [Plantactinospora sp. BB1]
MPARLLVTGAAGRIGRLLRPRLAGPERFLRLLDVAEQPPAAPGEPVEIVRADLHDPVALASACSGVDAVLHLAAIPGEDTFAELLRVNVAGTQSLLEAARVAGVPRVVLASSIHAAGWYRRAGSSPEPAGVPAPTGPDGVPATAPPRPDTYYGWSKAAVESLGSLYADRFGMVVFALRLGACFPEPPGISGLENWISPDDCARLVDACLRSDATGFRLLWGISRNSRRWWSLAEGREIGYEPEDDAEPYADRARPLDGEEATAGLVGAQFCAYPLGERQ